MDEVIKQLSVFSPPAPANFFGRDVIIKDLLGFVELSESITLLGAGGSGKTAIALTLLRHARTLTRFGHHRHFVPCHDLESSLDEFLGRLSDAMGVRGLGDMAQLQSRLSLSPRHILVLDGVESILDPLAPGAAEIAAAIEELSQVQHLCLLLTSRMDARIAGFRRIKVPTLSANGAQDIFYSSCRVGRSAEVNNLLEKLDFHSLSIDLLASAARENGWGEAKLLEAWGGGKANAINAYGRQSIEGIIRSTLGTPSIQIHGVTALETLKALAALPDGVEERKMESTIAETPEIGYAIDALCKFFLVYRQDGFFKMLSPFRLYFLESRQASVGNSGSDPVRDTTAENMQYIQRETFDSS